MFNKNQQGVTLYLAIVVLSLMTTVLLSLLSIVVSQTKAVITAGYSAIAFHAADTGAERILYDIFDQGGADSGVNLDECVYPLVCNGQPCNNCPLANWVVLSGARYKVCKDDVTDDVYQTTGEYRGTQRTIELDLTG